MQSKLYSTNEAVSHCCGTWMFSLIAEMVAVQSVIIIIIGLVSAGSGRVCFVFALSKYLI